MIFLLIRWKQYCPFLPHFCPRRPSFTNDFWRPTNALIYFHLQEHTSPTPYTGFEREWFAKQCIAPEDGISRSSFSGDKQPAGQLQLVFQELAKKRKAFFQKSSRAWRPCIHWWKFDWCSIINVLGDYRQGSKKAKGHFGFNINKGIPTDVHLSNGKGRRPFVSVILSPGETGIMDRGYQSQGFWSSSGEGKHFVCRIKVGTTKTIIEQNDVNSNSSIFYG